MSPPAMTVHQLGSQPQPRRKPPSSRSCHRSSASRLSVDFFQLTNRLADTADSAIQMQREMLQAQQSQSQQQMAQSQHLIDAQQSQTQQLLQAQQSQSQHLVDAQQLQSKQQAEAQQIQLEVQKNHLDTVQAHAADSLHLHTELARAEERLRHAQEVSDLRIQLAEKQAARQTDRADSPVSLHHTAQKYRVPRKI